MGRKYLSLITALLLLSVLMAGLGWLVYVPVRLERLNRALIAAIKQNDTKTALALLDKGADPNAQDGPPQHLSLWRLFLERLRGKHPATSYSETCLQMALEPSHSKYGHMLHVMPSVDMSLLTPPDPVVINALLDKGANPYTAFPSGETPLMEAITWDKDEVVEDLVTHGADVNTFARSQKIQTNPLIVAVSCYAPGKVKLLLAHGANPNIRDLGDTPLSLAKFWRSHSTGSFAEAEDKIIKMLQQAGAKE